MPQVRHLRYFVAVAEERSFTRAAERLHVAQQAVSSTVRQLELELGVSLLTRSTRKVELTPSGEALLEHGRKALASFESAWQAARGAAATPRVLLVAYDPILGYRFVSRAHQTLASQLPDMHVSWRPRYNSDLARDIAEGRLDAGVSIVPERHDGLEYETVAELSLHVIMGARHPLAGRPAVALTDLRGATIISLPRELAPRYVDMLASLYQTPEIDAHMIETPEPGGSTTTDLYERGEAVALAPESIVREFVDRFRHAVVGVPLEPAAPRVPVMMVWRSGSADPALHQFLGVCRAVAQGLTDASAGPVGPRRD